MHRPSRALTLALALVALAEPHAIGPAGPVQLTKGAAETVIKALQKDRADSENWLRSDATSYLATIARRDFGDKKTLTIGRAADNEVRVDAPGISPHHLRVTVVGDRFHVEGVDQQARVKVNTLAVAIRAGEMDSHYH
jgi:FHA domain